MYCQVCQKHEATVHQLDLSWDDQGHRSLRTLDLCAPCAKQRGIPVAGNIPSFPQVVSQLGKAVFGKAGLFQPSAPSQEDPGPTCPDCGWTLRDFRQTSRFGCAKDYEVFSEFVEEVLERIHGTREHPVDPRRTEAGQLRQEMAEAVAAEDYERAAQLRDRLRDLERSLEEAPDSEF